MKRLVKYPALFERAIILFLNRHGLRRIDFEAHQILDNSFFP
jgi:hypothetical protein